MRRYLIAVVAILVALSAAACGSAEEPEGPDLFAEYIESGEVRNDPFSTGTCCEDRMAHLASMGAPDQLAAWLFGATPCDVDGSDVCSLNDAVSEGAQEAAGAGASVHERGMLVKHSNGQLEWTVVLIANGPKGGAVVDSDGETYDDLDDFRANNDMYESDDWIMTASDITDVDGGSEVVTVSGHTTPNWVRWLIGAAAAAALIVAAVVVYRMRYFRSRIRPEEP